MGNILTIKGLTTKNRKIHLENINIELEAGYIYCLVGENGAGKSTLLKTIVDECTKYTGTILVEGIDAKRDHTKAMEKIGFVSEEHPFFETCSALENAKMLGSFYPKFSMERFEEMMKAFQISVNKKYVAMSRGEKMKFQMAFAQAYEPSVYLLDEVTAGMDPVFRIEFFEQLQKLLCTEKCSVLMTSHIVSEIEKKTDFVARMHAGKLEEFKESLAFAQG